MRGSDKLHAMQFPGCLRTGIVATLSLVFCSAFAQSGTTGPDKVNFKTNIGSFKILGGGETPATGLLDITFTGTVLVSYFEGTITAGPGVRKEFTKGKKQVYFGSGRITLDGKFRGAQFFGRNLSGSFKGFGVMRLYGEFDSKLETGEYWYEGKDHLPWGTGGMTANVPQVIYGSTVKPRVKDIGKG